ncbi:alanine/ornithine racemase family PLP-dependent enzyme [Cloacibacillus sp. An23]|uniref:alanine/ornithine racemase family PLP-dependent enzyme n=1 Tax=Cloacibacillus sp. An23 TaxID=1965591 RepID=UPI000B37A0EC|nr:alanine/ornithine racemase family PLP-dependent enzyme [Cloacibacillus sp. An23]OUO92842.1 hypothetical protein B5F39_10245 [Cloacibacillus sp. An23]
MYPKLIINLEKIQENTEILYGRTKKCGIEIYGVTKGCSADINVARRLINGGCSCLMDSRIQNLYSLRKGGINVPLFLLRIPMLSELSALLDIADGTVVSAEESIAPLETICRARQKSMNVIVMVDVGDLREGINPEDILRVGTSLAACRYVHCIGIGTNVGCFGGILPSAQNLSTLVTCKAALEDSLGYQIDVVSGGATSSLDLISQHIMPSEVNNLRIGEGILLGTNLMGYSRIIEGLHRDAFILEAEVVEVYVKPSKPFGRIGMNAFGQAPHFEDKGRRLRAIIALGRQDVNPDGLTPMDEGVEILGTTSDHMVLDVEGCTTAPVYGQKLRFLMNYSAMLMLTTSKYVHREYV